MMLRGLHLATISIVVAIACITPQTVLGLDTGSKEDDFSDLMAMYDPSTGLYAGLEPGDTYLFRDMVSYSKLDEEGDTRVWFESTGGSLRSYNLTVLGDWTSTLERGARIEFNVTVLGGPGGEFLDVKLEDIEVVKEAPRDGLDLGSGEEIVILGVTIPLDFLPDPLETPLFKAMIVFIAWMVLTIILWYITRLGLHLLDRTPLKLDTSVVRIIRRPFFAIVLLYGLLLCIAMLEPPSDLMGFIYKVYRIIVIVLVAAIMVKVLNRVILAYLKYVADKTENKADDILVPVMSKVSTVVIWVGAGVMVLDVFGVDVSVFIAGMGIAGLVIAFAAQDTLSNFFSGIILLIDRPFKEGDWIMMENKVYQVKDIGLRSTRLFHSFTNQLVTIPNNRISDHMFSNLNEPDMHGRTTIEVGVGYTSDPRKVGQILVDEVKSHPDTMEDADHVTFYRFNDYGDSALKFAVTFWVKDFNDQWKVSSELRERILYRFAREGIEIPFPQRVIHMAKD